LVEAATIPKDNFDQVFPQPELAPLEGIIELAQRCGVSVAIAAGRVRYLTGDYRKFARLVNWEGAQIVGINNPENRKGIAYPSEEKRSPIVFFGQSDDKMDVPLTQNTI